MKKVIISDNVENKNKVDHLVIDVGSEVIGQIADLLKYMREHPTIEFQVIDFIHIKPVDIALFFGADTPKNVYLPQSFWDVINYDPYYFEIEKINEERNNPKISVGDKIKGYGRPPILGTYFACLRVENKNGNSLGIFNTSQIKEIQYPESGYIVITQNSIYKMDRYPMNSPESQKLISTVGKEALFKLLGL